MGSHGMVAKKRGRGFSWDLPTCTITPAFDWGALPWGPQKPQTPSEALEEPASALPLRQLCAPHPGVHGGGWELVGQLLS